MTDDRDPNPRIVHRGKCSVCCTEFALKRDGTVRAHPPTGLNWRAGHCVGTGRAPRGATS